MSTTTTSTNRRAVRRRLAVLTAAAATLALAACGGSGFDDGQTGDGGDGGDAGGPLEVLIGSSGDAETRAVTEALDAWSAESGTEANLSVAADLPQQLSQGFAAGSPPDLFYVSVDGFPGYAANGSLEPYGDQIEADFYPTLVESFTYDDTFYCAPKDFSTLALIINDDAWEEAGLTASDHPATWEDLRSVAERLTTDDQVGLTFGPEWQRVGAFMAQAGGGLLDDAGSAAVDSPENAEALAFVQDMLADGIAAYPSAVDAGWGGEAFGLQAAAMTIEGNWVTGALANDFPDVDYTVVPLPSGPGGAGTLQFTNCWGVAADSQNKEAAIDLVRHLVADEQQMTFAEGFGVMPSVASVRDRWSEEFPEQAAFLDGVDDAQGVPPLEGVSEVIADFNAQLEGLAGGDPQAILSSVQSSMEAVAP
ncbi:extracellular solute-binding protein [Myceligenerans pegani]|uniref:Extracellular solute-binding protein n=1 Tax=Myceligenerans pegani TaxID=2776917 RepID=A0ABR9N0V6_9MICO|nr:extracellular solute-binding protein [Myceligenerans sp. TRM 65318]MBE1877293.1 extracellular solute-binding protein [Myceligenerans sp. TRM 65318]MBE3019564.1 extracellular solute-binding protein [Myceligenerans sp. TRM 65318]